MQPIKHVMYGLSPLLIQELETEARNHYFEEHGAQIIDPIKISRIGSLFHVDAEMAALPEWGEEYALLWHHVKVGKKDYFLSEKLTPSIVQSGDNSHVEPNNTVKQLLADQTQ